MALMHLRGATSKPAALRIAHAGAGFLALRLLTWAYDEPRHGDPMGVASFGAAAAILVAVALVLGLWMGRFGGRWPKIFGVSMAAHATIAITAFVLFLAWASLG